MTPKRLFLIATTLLTMTAFTECHRHTGGVNPLLDRWETPYGMPPFDSIRPKHFTAALEQGMREHRADITVIKTDNHIPDFAHVIMPLDTCGELLRRTWAVFQLMRDADSNDELRSVDSLMSPLVMAHYDSLYTDQDLFRKVRKAYENLSTETLTPEQIRLTELTYRRFVRGGAELNDAERKRLSEINHEISTLSVRFSHNLLAATADTQIVVDSSAELAGFPDEVVSAALHRAEEQGLDKKCVFTLDRSSMIPFLTFCKDKRLREKIYTAYTERCRTKGPLDNRPIVAAVARLRAEKAHLLGYADYAAYVLDEQMAATPEHVYNLLDRLWKPSLDSARREVKRLMSYKARETPDSTIRSWDWWYYAEKQRTDRNHLDEATLNNYFSLPGVQTGVFMLANRLWGTTFRPVSVPVYNAECTVFEVLDRNNTHLGLLLFDYHQRAGKQGGAWCTTLRDAHYTLTGRRLAPIVCIVTNFAPSLGTTPTLLSTDDVRTLFHEFGHAMHALFAQNRYLGTVSTERDFVELPSQIMENWAFAPQMLRLYAHHYQTGELMPQSMIDSLQRSTVTDQSFAMVELLAATYLDMDLHTLGEGATPSDIDLFEQKALRRRGLIPQIEPRYHLPYFNHLFLWGYEAGYYSYLWSELIECDVYQAFIDSGDLFDRKTAERYRKQILERAGTAPGMELYRNFRGKQEPDIQPMLIRRGLARLPKPDTTVSEIDRMMQQNPSDAILPPAPIR